MNLTARTAMQFEFFGTSETGLHRKNNEDSYLVDSHKRLFLLADGMGGQAMGEIASKLAVESVMEFFSAPQGNEVMWPMAHRKAVTKGENRLFSAVAYANEKILEFAIKHPSGRGMGTTLLGAFIDNNHLAVVSIGDSRLYQFRNGVLQQITQDHTLVEVQVKMGLLGKNQARKHPARHVLTSALGADRFENITVDFSHIPLAEEDIYLMCSDGLHDMLADEKILSIIDARQSRPLEEIGISLIKEACSVGGKDNITIILLRFC